METSPVLVSAIAEGETVFEYLETLARQQSVRLVTDPTGDLVITRAGIECVGTALVLGENIEEAEGEFSHRDRFSHYYVTGQRAGNNTWPDDKPELAAQRPLWPVPAGHLHGDRLAPQGRSLVTQHPGPGAG
ncbi:hypothetical protein [Candidatus Vondammii sp. HM_W22]|uniref:hypothetical protein n=1 Tax=Candidatus Vondammii sp. HM_W22 TaxID=2687299 RepID=UPI002E7B442B|nr:hypothetical protein [Candidatus Vondammii sp. HM_W22]